MAFIYNSFNFKLRDFVLAVTILHVFGTLHLRVGARGVDLGLCDDARINCQCGSNPGYTITTLIKQCTYFYKWRNYCKPCNDIKQEDICPNFKNCQECDVNNLKQCISCPPNRYGTWCESVCNCKNGATCDNRGNCNCVNGFRGKYCEINTGCQPPEISPPLLETRVPLTQPLFIEYQCPPGHELIGVNRVSCLPSKEWSHPPPTCQVKCDLPGSIPNVMITANRRPVLQGDTVGFVCNEGHSLFGASSTVCGGDGNFDQDLPSCIKVIECSKPLKVLRAETKVSYPIPQIIDRYYNGTVINYQCDEDLFMYGKNEIRCLYSGQWSSQPPSCVKIPDASVSCETPASKVLDENGVIVRLQCPPGCAMTQDAVYGTVIYHYESSVCRAAIHGGKITNEGGSVFLTNSGHYSDFIGSALHDITSQGKPEAGISFRFTYNPDRDFNPAISKSSGSQVCPTGWTAIEGYCSLYVKKAKAWEMAKSTCNNMGSRLPVLKDGKFLSSTKTALGNVKGLNETWLLSKRHPNFKDAVVIWKKLDGDPKESSTFDTFKSKVADKDSLDGLCTVVEFEENILTWKVRDCETMSPFFCVYSSEDDVEESCEDPGPLKNGFAEFEGKDQGFQKGAVIKYHCEPLHYLSGSSSTMCSSNATWTNPKPRCVKIVTCTDPPIPKYGSVKILPPDETISQLKRTGTPIVRSRIGRPNLPPGRRTVSSVPQKHPNRIVLNSITTTELTTLADTTTDSTTLVDATTSFSTQIQEGNSTTQVAENFSTTESPIETTILPEIIATPRTLRAGLSANSRDRITPNSLSYKPSRDPVLKEQDVDQNILQNITIPEGHYRVGTRMSYSCESRYYDIVGSTTRRCESDGNWSGRGVTCVPVCGRSDSPRTPFITNGNATEVGQWPWQVGVSQFLPEYDTFFLLCGGALISETWVVTAAHCVTSPTGQILPPAEFKFQFGKYHRNNELDDEMVEERMAKEIHVHPDFDSTLYDADIALVQLDIPVVLTSRVQPICLPTDSSTRTNIVDGKKGVVTGWGLNENDEYSETLRQAVIPVVDHSKCEKGYEKAGLPLSVSTNMFCGGYEQGKIDACNGDSGGPMVFLDESSKGRRWLLEGIVSWGSPSGCGNPQQYGGFTLVHKFLSWIQQFV